MRLNTILVFTPLSSIPFSEYSIYTLFASFTSTFLLNVHLLLFYFISHVIHTPYYDMKDSDGLPDWIACRIVTIDFEFPSNEVTTSTLTSSSNEDVINGLVMVLQLTPLHLSHSKSKDKNEEVNSEYKGSKSNSVFSLKRTFFVLYRPGHNSPEFLLKRTQICQCLTKTWHIAPHTQAHTQKEAHELAHNSGDIPSTHDLRRTVHCNRRFSCTYDNGEVYSGVVVRVTRDLQGIPLWSGQSLKFHSLCCRK